jgi:hypothetical protein
MSLPRPGGPTASERDREDIRPIMSMEITSESLRIHALARPVIVPGSAGLVRSLEDFDLSNVVQCLGNDRQVCSVSNATSCSI